MKVSRICVRNFRRLEDVTFDVEDRETVFVGPNNSGKTSATAIFRCFLGRRDFRIHDFSVSRIAELNAFGETGDEQKLLRIELDIWFKVDPNSVAFGRAFTLLPNLSDNFERLGVRLAFGVTDAKKLRADYTALYPAQDSVRAKTLAQFLAVEGNFKRHFDISYFSLAETGSATPLARDEGKKLLRNLVRVDFIDAQRNIDDDDNSRSNRLSTAFAAFYRKNLEQTEVAAAASKVIDENNQQLTEHYDKQFAPLISLIRGLGVPSINDRELRIISSLSPETALKGNTELLYVDPVRKHELPELYNGLGFKNLIYMAIQAQHYHSQWMQTPENRPLCQLLFVEEPEVHLHAQVQQTFIGNIWIVIQQSAKAGGQEDLVPQILVTTHSSHILDAVDFSKVRYFRRCPLNGESGPPGILNASEVRSLQCFRPKPETNEGKIVTPEESLKFLNRYLRLTHCDLFFADGAILVEGAAEKLLLPAMIEKVAPDLQSVYLTILEVGGAYAHRFEGLLSFLRIPYLVITDLDSVEAAGHRKACRGDTADAQTSNATLKKFLAKTTIAELLALAPSDKTQGDKDRCVAFQIDIEVQDNGASMKMLPRTLEEAIAYQNFAMLRGGQMALGVQIPAGLNAAYQEVYQHVQSSDFKKTDFALSLLSGDESWTVPNYIVVGLQWLKGRLCPQKMPAGAEPAA